MTPLIYNDEKKKIYFIQTLICKSIHNIVLKSPALSKINLIILGKIKKERKKLIIYQTWTLITPNTTHHNISKHIHMHKMLILALVNLTRKLKICRFLS